MRRIFKGFMVIKKRLLLAAAFLLLVESFQLFIAGLIGHLQQEPATSL